MPYIELLEENIGKTFSDINCTNVYLGRSSKAIEIKVKTNKWDLTKLTSFARKGNHQQNEKTTNRLGENICKRCDQQGINLQNTNNPCTLLI